MELNWKSGREKNSSCRKWNELEFLSYCQDELSPLHKARLESHLENCDDCRERFNFSWDVIMADYSAQDLKADSDLLADPLWHQQKEELARSHAKAVSGR